MNTVYNTDCLTGMKTMPAECVNLIFTDPPCIYELTYDNLSDEAVPKQYDDMTIATYKRMMELWEVACKNSPIVYEEYDGDYCTRAHVSL